MARSRNIKPAFFKNEDLSEIAAEGRLLFIGLWCLADRNGLIEYRPKRIKAELFPYEPEIDVNGYITVLERLGFIRILTGNGIDWIHVVNFSLHQNPHNTEKTSNPDPKSLIVKSNVTTTVIEPLNNGSCPADSLTLIPSTLIPDSRKPAPQNDSGACSSPAGEICKRLKAACITGVNPSHAKLQAMLANGFGVEEIASIGEEAGSKGKGMAWVLAVASGRRRDADAMPRASPRTPAPDNFESKDYGPGGLL